MFIDSPEIYFNFFFGKFQIIFFTVIITDKSKNCNLYFDLHFIVTPDGQDELSSEIPYIII